MSTTSAAPQTPATPVPEDAETVDSLRAEHRRLDDQVRELERKVALSAAEQVEYARLKKRKLLTKDRLRALGAPVTPRPRD